MQFILSKVAWLFGRSLLTPAIVAISGCYYGTNLIIDNSMSFVCNTFGGKKTQIDRISASSQSSSSNEDVAKKLLFDSKNKSTNLVGPITATSFVVSHAFGVGFLYYRTNGKLLVKPVPYHLASVVSSGSFAALISTILRTL